WAKGVSQDSDASIDAAVRKIRRALGDDANSQRFIVTAPAKGYRFIAEVREEPPATAETRPGQTPAVEAIRGRSEQPARHREGALAEEPAAPPTASQLEHLVRPPAAGGLAWGRFIGRAEEMAALRAAIDASLSGQPSLVMVAGEPGIGKTRLA